MPILRTDQAAFCFVFKTCFKFILGNFMHYILTILFFPPLILSRPFPTSLPTQLHVISLLKQTNKKANKQTMESNCCWLTPLSLGGLPCLESDWYTQHHLIEGKWFSIYQQLSIGNGFLGRGGTSWPLPLLWFEFVQALSMLSHVSICEFICASSRCLENAVSLVSSVTSGS